MLSSDLLGCWPKPLHCKPLQTPWPPEENKPAQMWLDSRRGQECYQTQSQSPGILMRFWNNCTGIYLYTIVQMCSYFSGRAWWPDERCSQSAAGHPESDPPLGHSCHLEVLWTGHLRRQVWGSSTTAHYQPLFEFILGSMKSYPCFLSLVKVEIFHRGRPGPVYAWLISGLLMSWPVFSSQGIDHVGLVGIIRLPPLKRVMILTIKVYNCCEDFSVCICIRYPFFTLEWHWGFETISPGRKAYSQRFWPGWPGHTLL